MQDKNFKGSDVTLSTNVHRSTYLSRSVFVTFVDKRTEQKRHFKTRAAATTILLHFLKLF